MAAVFVSMTFIWTDSLVLSHEIVIFFTYRGVGPVAPTPRPTNRISSPVSLAA
jgi:hypothetical protein